MVEDEKNIMDKYSKEYYDYLSNLFLRANNAGSFEYLCTLLRVRGITNGDHEKRRVLSLMERSATTVEELKKVQNYVVPDTAMARIIDNRIKLLQNEQVQDPG